MKWYLIAAVVLILSMAVMFLNRRSADERLHLAHPQNKQMDFYGLAVDQDNAPLQGVPFEMVAIAVEGNPFRGEQRNIRTKLRAVSGSDGRFEVHAVGEVIDEISATLPGYRLLIDDSAGVAADRRAGDNRGFGFWSWGDQGYAGDPANPAIYVFVKNGVNVVTAQLSRGGTDGAPIPIPPGDPPRLPNLPGFPRRPSIPGLTFVEPTTQPTATSAVASLPAAASQPATKHAPTWDALFPARPRAR